MTGFEPLIVAATAGLTGIITDVVKSKGGDLLKRYDVNLKRIQGASREYIENYAKRHGELKIVCVRMDSPVKLDEIYTAVQLLERSDVRYFESADALQDLFRQVGKRGFEFRESTRQNGLKVANQHQSLMVLGSPGIGKSTFLRKVGLEALKGKNGIFQHACIPVFIVLRQFDNSKTIEQLISEEFANCGFEEAAALTQAALENGKLLVLLDGLDEVPREHENKAIDQIQNLVDRYGDNRFITSCRIAAYKGGFTRFKDVIVAAFEDAQIEEFIRHWFADEPAIADACWSLLKQPEYAAAKELAQTPLLLTLLCAVYNESQDFPKNRAAVYGEALDVLLKKWSAEKRLQRDPIYKELSPELEKILLSEIAFDSFESDRLFFSKSEVVEQIRKFLVDNLNAPKHLDGEAVLEAIEIQQGLLVERARETYSFSHLTLQEYLTAKYIIDNNQINLMVENHLMEIPDNWREVFLLVAGQMPGRSGADALLLSIEKEARRYTNNPKLEYLLHWADEITSGSQGDYSPLEKRAAAIFLAYILNHGSVYELPLCFVSTKDLLYNFDFTFRLEEWDIISLSIENVNELQQAKIFNSVSSEELINQLKTLNLQISHLDLNDIEDDAQSQEDIVELTGHLRNLWNNAFHLNAEMMNWSGQEEILLTNYLYSNELMLICKEAAVRVSAETWEAIESRMLKV
ncbi:MAG: NACHT domain-containing protein [Leptolyngbyaceae cyanobacterium SM1_3_5]|nr:NACHT domain-containing protein [Leptolyngbyaceae cyanobacterium SM1_3_5]